ncbi:MAG: branched-chain amino acid ABC transporter permease [Beijerinckiaceae bacterium]
MTPAFLHTLRTPWLWLAVLIVGSFPWWVSSYHLGIAILALLYVSLALAWNIVGGMAGQISLAHSVFIGMGAVVATALNLRLGLNLWLGLLLCALGSAILGGFLALLDSRFRLAHLSFALITLAFAEIGELVVTGSDFLGGASGLYYPKATGGLVQFDFGGSTGYLLAALLLALICLLVNAAILASPLGYYLRALRDNENAAQAIGIGILRNRAIAMAISAALSSVVGTLYARYLGFVDPTQLASPTIVIEVVLIATIGGLGTPWGPLVAASVLVPAAELLRGKLGGILPGLHYFLYGVLIIVVVLTSPQGLVPRLATLFRRAGRRAGENQ